MNIFKQNKTDEHLFSRSGNQGMSKIDRYGWSRENLSWGEYLFIAKDKLNIDDRYQRNTSGKQRIHFIARNFDAVLFQALIVARRSDGSYWVIEGGHRARAAMMRSDIKEVPCIVHEICNITEEAKKFLGINKIKTIVNSIDTFRAKLGTGDDITVKANTLIEELGYSVSTSSGRGFFKAVSTLCAYIEKDYETAKKAMVICRELYRGETISGSVLRAIFMVGYTFREYDLLTDKNVIEKILKEGPIGIERAIRAEKYQVGMGGEIVEAKALLKIINHRKSSHKLKWPNTSID